MNSPISWVGGKSRMRKHIIPLFPTHTCYVEVFGGSGAVLFGKEKSKVEVYNDKYDWLVNMFQVFKNKPEEFLNSFDFLPISRTIFNQFRDDYYHPEQFSDVQKAVRFFYLVKASFGSTVPEQGGGCVFGVRTESPSRLNLDKLESNIRNTYERIKHVFVENLDFEDCINRYDKEHTLFYCDPPYLGSREYSIKFGEDEHRRLFKKLKSIKGKFVLSINPNDLIYDLYRDFYIIEFDHNYSMRQSDHNTPCKELIVTNFQPHQT